MHLYQPPRRTHLCQGCLPRDCGTCPKNLSPVPSLAGGRNCPIEVMFCYKSKAPQPLWVLVWIRAVPSLKAWLQVLRR